MKSKTRNAVQLILVTGVAVLATFVSIQTLFAADVACYGLLNENVVCPSCPANADLRDCQTQLMNDPALQQPLSVASQKRECPSPRYKTTVAQVGPYGLPGNSPCSTAPAATGYLCKPKTLNGNAAPQEPCGGLYNCVWDDDAKKCITGAIVGAPYKALVFVKDPNGCAQLGNG